jgi:hypothetical protein
VEPELLATNQLLALATKFKTADEHHSLDLQKEVMQVRQAMKEMHEQNKRLLLH